MFSSLKRLYLKLARDSLQLSQQQNFSYQKAIPLAGMKNTEFMTHTDRQQGGYTDKSDLAMLAGFSIMQIAAFAPALIFSSQFFEGI